MKIYSIQHGLAHTGVTTLESLPTTAEDGTIVVIVGDLVNRHRTSDTKEALDSIRRKIDEDARISGL